MYDYRRMTPEQRRQVVEARRERHLPLRKPPHLSLGPGWYLISAATFEHRHHFCTTHELTALTQRLLEALQTTRRPIVGCVVMPNHYLCGAPHSTGYVKLGIM